MSDHESVTLWVRIEVPAKNEEEAAQKIREALDADQVFGARIFDTWDMNVHYGGQHR